MARRVNYTKAFKEKLGEIPALLVDTGHYLAHEASTHGDLRFDSVVRSERVLKSYDAFPVDAANLSAYEAPFVSRLLSKDRRAAAAKEYPVLDRLVSANIVGESKEIAGPRAFLIKEVVERLKTPARKPTRIAFVGLSSPEAKLPRGMRLIDPVEAAKQVVPEARKGADIVIVLAHLQTDPLVRIAREVPGIDVIINGSGDIFRGPMRLGDTFIAFTPYEMRSLGELRFYRDGQGKLSVWDRYISLDDEVGDDPEALEVVNAASEAESSARESMRNLLDNWIAATRLQSMGYRGHGGSPQPAPGGYVSSAACGQCHMEQYTAWANSKHARATDPLVFKKYEFEASCLACHSTGYRETASSDLADLSKLHNVQCEQCHGPGAEHVAKPGKGYGVVADLGASCSACHTPQTSPAFDLKAAWERIKH